jgi:hypothetical protein
MPAEEDPMTRKASSVLRGLMIAVGSVMLVVPAKAGQPFDYFSNSRSVVGLKDYDTGVRIEPDNSFGGIQVKVGPELTPLTADCKKTLLNGWMPITVLRAKEGDVAYDTLIWVSPLPTVKDWRAAYDWPVEGEKYLLWAMVRATNTGRQPADAKAALADKTFSWTLAPGACARGVLRKAIGAAGNFDDEDADLWLARTIDYWQSVRDSAPRIEVPDRKVSDAFWAALAYQYISNDNGKFRPGEGFWDNYWMRDAAYMEVHYAEMGKWDVVWKGFEYMWSWQQADGNFDCAYDGQQGPQYDGNGQAIWSIWRCFTLSGNREWMTANYPRLKQAADWIVTTRQKPENPFPGVLPGAPADGENLWDGKHHIVGYDLWNLRGLLCAADVAQSLGETQDAEAWLKDATGYRKAIDEASKKAGVVYFPPSWEKAGTSWGNTETLWPTELFDTKDPRVAGTINYVHDEFEGGFKEGLIQWERGMKIIHGYMGAFNIMSSIRQGNYGEQAVKDFYWYLLHTSSAHAFAEIIGYEKRYANNETIPHTWGGVNYALMLRHMLVDERGDELHLLCVIPDWWLEKGREIRAEGLPTDFGEFSLVVRGTDKGVEADLVKPARTAPKRIVLHLPESRPLVKPIEGVDVVVRGDQKERWDYPKVVSLFRKEKDPQSPEPLAYENSVLHETTSRITAHTDGLVAPEQAVFLREVKVALAAADKNEKIRYTLDGSDPTASSPLYGAPLKLTGTTTVKARAESGGRLEGGIPWSFTYQYQPFTVKVDGLAKIKVPGLFFGKTATVSFDLNANNSLVRYTLDPPPPGAGPECGGEPTTNSPAFTKPIVLDRTTTVAARCFDAANKPYGRIFQEKYTLANVEDNLTTGKPATASRSGSGEVPELAVDGMVEVKSAFEPTFWGSAPYPQWWMVDLEKAANLQELQLYTFWGDGRSYQYTIEGSTDGKAWHTLVDASTNAAAADAKGYTHTFKPTPARYVRVNMLKNSNNQGVHIVELRAYEAR